MYVYSIKIKLQNHNHFFRFFVAGAKHWEKPAVNIGAGSHAMARVHPLRALPAELRCRTSQWTPALFLQNKCRHRQGQQIHGAFAEK